MILPQLWTKKIVGGKQQKGALALVLPATNAMLTAPIAAFAITRLGSAPALQATILKIAARQVHLPNSVFRSVLRMSTTCKFLIYPIFFTTCYPGTRYMYMWHNNNNQGVGCGYDYDLKSITAYCPMPRLVRVTEASAGRVRRYSEGRMGYQ